MKRLSCLLLLFAAGCGYTDFDPLPKPAPPALVPEITLSTLRGMCVSGPVVFAERDVVLSGIVTTSDKENNFFRTFFIEDNSGAAEVMAGLYDLHNGYAPGRRLTIRAEGLAAVLRDGLLKIGMPGGEAGREVGYMDSRVILDRHLLRGESAGAPAPLSTTIPRLIETRTGMLVQLKGLRVDVPSDTTWAVPAALAAGGTPRTAAIKFRDGRGDSLYVVTSGYASFAGERVPTGSVALTGILLRGKVGGKMVFQLKMRDLHDIQNDD